MKLYELHLDKPDLTIEEEKEKKYDFEIENGYLCWNKKEIKEIIEYFKEEMENYAKDHNLTMVTCADGINVEYYSYYKNEKGEEMQELYAQTFFNELYLDDDEELEKYMSNNEVGFID